MKIEWKRKLSSRKLWMAFGLFVSGVLSFWINPEVVAKIVGCIMQGASVIGYIVAEGLVDARRLDDGTYYVGDNYGGEKND